VALAPGTLIPQIGDELPVVVSATNTSTADMTAASIAVSLPSLIKVKDATPSQGTFDPTAMQWTLGPLASGASATLTLVLDVADSGPQVLQAALQASTPDDGNPANDVAQVTLNIYAPTRTVADLEVRIEGSSIATPAGTAQYAIRAANFGSSYAVDEAIAVTTPTFGAVTASSGGVCTAPPVGGAGQVRCVWSGQSVVGGSPRDVALELRVDPGVSNGEVVSVTAFVSNLTQDPTLANNTFAPTPGAGCASRSASSMAIRHCRSLRSHPGSGRRRRPSSAPRGSASPSCSGSRPWSSHERVRRRLVMIPGGHSFPSSARGGQLVAGSPRGDVWRQHPTAGEDGARTMF
jgi:hypothetical protein